MSTRTMTARVAALCAVVAALVGGSAAPASAAPAHHEWLHDAGSVRVLGGFPVTADPDGIDRIWCEMTEDTVSIKVDVTDTSLGFIWADFFYRSSFGPNLVRVDAPDHEWVGTIDRAWVEQRATGQGFDVTQPWRMWVMTNRGMFIEGEPCVP